MRFYDLGLERSVLRVISFHYPSLVKLSTKHLLRSDHFSDMSHRRIFRAIKDVYQDGDVRVERKLVRNQLKKSIKNKKNSDKALSVFARIAKPPDEAISNVDVYVDELDSLLVGRKLQFLVKDMAGYLGEGNIADALGAVQKMTSTPDSSIPVEDSDFLDIFEDTITLDKQKKQYPELFRRFPSGITGVNPYTGEDMNADKQILNGGWIRGTFILIGGDTGLGKSKTLSHVFRHGVKKNAKGVFMTNEMTLDQVKTDFISGITGIEFNKIDRGQLEEEDYSKIRSKMRFYKKRNAGAKIVSYPEVSTVGTFRAKLLEYKQEGFNADFAVLDYLNELSGDTSGADIRGDWSSIGKVASDLRSLAMSWDTGIELDNGYRIYGMPVLSAAQRKTTSAGKAGAKTEDVAFSPVPGQVAACVGHLTQDADMREMGVIDLRFTKCRFGRPGLIRLYPDFSKSRLHSKKRVKEAMNDSSFDLGE